MDDTRRIWRSTTGYIRVRGSGSADPTATLTDRKQGRTTLVMDPPSGRTVHSDERSAGQLDDVRTAIASRPEGVSSKALIRSTRLRIGAESSKFDVCAALYQLHARGDVRFGRDRRWRARTSPPREGEHAKAGATRSRSPATPRRAPRSRTGWLWTDTGERGEGVQSAVCAQIATLERRGYGRSIAVFARNSTASDGLRNRSEEGAALTCFGFVSQPSRGLPDLVGGYSATSNPTVATSAPLAVNARRGTVVRHRRRGHPQRDGAGGSPRV